MKAISPESLFSVMTAEFPPTASCWSQATDEVRDMCRAARILAGLGEDDAVDFRQLNTPAEWNKAGVEGTVKFYRMLGEDKRQEFCSEFENWLSNWLSSLASDPSHTKH